MSWPNCKSKVLASNLFCGITLRCCKDVSRPRVKFFNRPEPNSPRLASSSPLASKQLRQVLAYITLWTASPPPRTMLLFFFCSVCDCLRSGRGRLWQTAAHKFQKFENNNKYFSRADRNYFKSPAARHLSLGQAKRRLVVSSASQAGTAFAVPWTGSEAAP